MQKYLTLKRFNLQRMAGTDFNAFRGVLADVQRELNQIKEGAGEVIRQRDFDVAAAGFLLRRHRLGRLPLLSAPYFFTLANTAALLGVLSIVAGRRLHAWTPRSGLNTGEGLK